MMSSKNIWQIIIKNDPKVSPWKVHPLKIKPINQMK